jgi:hypothetical protein
MIKLVPSVAAVTCAAVTAVAAAAVTVAVSLNTSAAERRHQEQLELDMALHDEAMRTARAQLHIQVLAMTPPDSEPACRAFFTELAVLWETAQLSSEDLALRATAAMSLPAYRAAWDRTPTPADTPQQRCFTRIVDSARQTATVTPADTPS